MSILTTNPALHMVTPCCPQCGRSCNTVLLAGYRNWCESCFNKHVAFLPMPDGACNLEKDSKGVWQWVEIRTANPPIDMDIPY